MTELRDRPTGLSSRTGWRIVLGGLVAFGLVAMAFVLLETYAAYRSPVRAPAPSWSPRTQGREDFENWLTAKEEAARQRAELMRSLDTATMVQLGREIVEGKGLCLNCHSVGDSAGGAKGPNLEDVGRRATDRVEGMSDVDYLAQSLYRPNAYVVEGYVGSMTEADQPPIGLDDLEIKMVVAYLQTLGGQATVGPDSVLPFAGDR